MFETDPFLFRAFAERQWGSSEEARVFTGSLWLLVLEGWCKGTFHWRLKDFIPISSAIVSSLWTPKSGISTNRSFHTCWRPNLLRLKTNILAFGKHWRVPEWGWGFPSWFHFLCLSWRGHNWQPWAFAAAFHWSLCAVQGWHSDHPWRHPWF